MTVHERARGSRDRELGADLLLLNTAFSGPQLVDVLARESTRAVICDEEFIPLIDEVPDDVLRVIAWQDTPDHDRASVDSLIASVSAGRHPRAPIVPRYAATRSEQDVAPGYAPSRQRRTPLPITRGTGG